MPAFVEWKYPVASDWADLAFSYQALLIMAVIGGLALLVWEGANWSHIKMCDTLIDKTSYLSDHSLAPEDVLEDVRSRLRAALGRRQALIEPAIGGFFITLCVWLAAVIVAAKLDPEWSRPFMVPPSLVAQNLQSFGRDLAEGLLRSSFHLLQGILWGGSLGVFFGFLLSHVTWFQRWTAWHLTIVSALPPFLMFQVFKQFTRVPWFPAYVEEGEVAFKSAVVMVAWAVMWPVLTATAHGLSRIDREFRYSIRLLGARSVLSRLKHIDLPVILPSALSNLRVGVVIGLVVLLLAESEGGPRDYPTLGLHYSEVTQNYKLQTLIALVVFTSILVVACELGIRLLELRFVVGRSREKGQGEEKAPSVAEEQRSALEEFESLRDAKWSLPQWMNHSWAGDGNPAVHVKRVSKSFPGTIALRVDEPIDIQAGEFVSVIGRSGAGKSTLLKLLLGLEAPDRRPDSELAVGGINALDSHHLGRKAGALISYVAQRPQLLPNRTVEQNLMFGLRQQWKNIKRNRIETDEKGRQFYSDFITWLCGEGDPSDWSWGQNRKKIGSQDAACPLELLVKFFGLSDKMSNYPYELSGGEAQRVHLLRWLVLARPLLFLDEAFSALDQPLKGMVRDAIQRHAKSLGITVVNISHDRADVLQISDRVLFVDEHKICGDGSPRALYYSPATLELAMFLGHTNIFVARHAGVMANTLNVESDAYRKLPFDPPVKLPLQGQLLSSEGNVAEISDGRKVFVFIPRSEVNIDGLFVDVEPLSVPLAFDVERVRFMGTHYELRLSRVTESGQRFRMDTILEDDVLDDLLNRSGLRLERLESLKASISVRRAVVMMEEVAA